MVIHDVDIIDMRQHRFNVEFCNTSCCQVVNGIKSTSATLLVCRAAVSTQCTAACTKGRLSFGGSRQVLRRNFVTISSTTRSSFIFHCYDYHQHLITTIASRPTDCDISRKRFSLSRKHQDALHKDVDIEAVACVHNLQYKFSTKFQFFCVTFVFSSK